MFRAQIASAASLAIGPCPEGGLIDFGDIVIGKLI